MTKHCAGVTNVESWKGSVVALGRGLGEQQKEFKATNKSPAGGGRNQAILEAARRVWVSENFGA